MKFRLWSIALVSLLLAVALSSCKSNSAASEGVKLQGAGATFPAPLYEKWAKDFSASHPDVEVDYQSVGSGAGKKNVIDKTVDFGASDAAMTEDEMAKVQGGVQLFPMTAGAIVLSYNLPGVNDLKLTRKAYTGIFLGTVTKWNDPEIVAANPGANLPNAPINVALRSDGSGTSFVFSKHLSAVNPDFAAKVGANTLPNWPVGTKAKGNEGVTASIKSTPGSIGYIEYGFARSQNMPMALLQNKAGKFESATTQACQAALAAITLPDNLIGWASDPDSADAYPIVTYTWMIFYKHYGDAKKLAAAQDLLKYGLTDGQKDADALGYIPLPSSVVSKDMAAVQTLSN